MDDHPLPIRVPADPATAANGPEYTGEPDCWPEPVPPAAAAAPTSLDNLETSVTANIPAFSPDGTPVLDQNSTASRFRHSGWRIQRKRVWEGLVRTFQPAGRLKAFATCGSFGWLQRSNIQEPTPDGPRHRFRIACHHCRDRLCVPCANARSRLIHQKLAALTHGQCLTFVTLTLCGRKESLRDLIDRLYKSFRALRAHPLWLDNVHGGAAFLEIKWSDKAQRWHPHLHIVCNAKYIPVGELTQAWRSITKDSFIVDIRRIKNPVQVERYVTKYASKPLNTSFSNSPRLLDEAIMALKGRRLCLCFYAWYGTPLAHAEDEELADDMIDAAGYTNYLPWAEFLNESRDGNPEALQILRDLGCEDRWRMLLHDPPPD